MVRWSQQDPKVEALHSPAQLGPPADAVSDPAFEGSGFLDARDLVQVKYEIVRRVRVDKPPSVGRPSPSGSRPSFYEATAAFDEAGLAGLVPQPPIVANSRLDSPSSRPLRGQRAPTHGRAGVLQEVAQSECR